jgi:nucleotide-binding universal stress UspA family protein
MAGEEVKEMLPITKILCPTDFSEPSYEAIKVAGELAFHFDSELCVLHVVSPVPLVPMGVEPSGFNVPLYEHELETSSKKSLEEIINQMEWKDLKVRLIVVRGNAADEIVRTAEGEDADLIVIATRGRTGLDRLIFGSVAEKVVRLARCPVLTVTGRPEKGELSMSATDDKLPEGQSEKKKAYQEKIEAQLKEWGAKIEELKAKAETSKVELKIKYQKQMEDLRAKQDAVQHRLRELKESGEGAWEGLRTGLEKSLGEFRGSLDSTLSTFKEKGGEAIETVSKKRKVYVDKVESQLKEWGTEIDILKAKAEKAKAEAKIKYYERIKDLRAKQESLGLKLQELKGSGGEAWEEVKTGVDKAVKELKEAFKRAKSKWKEK